MNHSSINASVAMQNLQKQLDIISNNIANVDTTGYKQKDVSFEDVLTNTVKQPSVFMQKGRLTPSGFTQGFGSKLSAVQMDMAEGSLEKTDQPTDVAMEGQGLFEVNVHSSDSNGNTTDRTAWTRDGSFQLTPQGTDRMALATKDGYLVKGIDDQPIYIPTGNSMQIDQAGRVFAKSDVQAEPNFVGQIKLVRIYKPQLLQSLGKNLFGLSSSVNNANGMVLQAYDPTQATGKPELAVHQGMLEHSNVNLADEMTKLMVVQRAYQLNARAIVSSDTMSNLANHLKG